MMLRALALFLLAVVLAHCSDGGGGGSVVTTPVPPWAKFRRDMSNTGAVSASVGRAARDSGPVRVFPPLSEPALDPISASPVIGIDHTIYFATEGGELIAIDRDLNEKWRLSACTTSTGTSVPFGPIRSSPALTAVRSGLPLSEQNDKVLYFGDDTGNVFAVQDHSDGPRCQWVFSSPTERSAIVSSPTFLIDLIEQVITGIYFGSTGGVFYALNQDGTLKWQFPPAGQPPLGAIISSPAVDIGGPLYFTAADGNLYALDLDGIQRFRFPLQGAVDPSLSTSPARGQSLYLGTGDGTVQAIAIDGASRKWRFLVPNGQPVVASLGIGVTQAAIPTPTTRPGSEPTPGVPTPTPTVLVSVRTIIYAVARDGVVYPLDDINGGQIAAGVAIAPAAAPSVSSPAVSGDGCAVFGDDAGNLNIRLLSVTTDATPTPTSSLNCIDNTIPLNPDAREPFAVRSSPAIDTDGVIYVGADDGRLYAVGTAND
jgi:outer membrane protein assembly factor BamB